MLPLCGVSACHWRLFNLLRHGCEMGLPSSVILRVTVYGVAAGQVVLHVGGMGCAAAGTKH